MATSYYARNTTTIDYGNSDNLDAVAGGATTAFATGTETFNFGGFIRIQPHGGASSVVGAYADGNGHGWMLDDSSLDGTTIPAGVWTALLRLKCSDSSATGDLLIRFAKTNPSLVSFTTLGDASVTGVTIDTTGVNFTLTSASLASMSLAAGEKLYYEIWWHQTSGGSATNLISVSRSTDTHGVAGFTGLEIQVPSGATILTGAATSRITLPASAAAGSTGAGTSTISLGGSATASVLPPTPTRPLPRLPLISRNAPAYANANAYAAGLANDASYGFGWRSVNIPPGQPVYLAYDLSGVASGARGRVVVNLLNEGGGQYYNTTAANAIALMQDYILEGNASAGGGAMPSTGWVTLASVTGNYYPTRQHILDLTGYNWLRFTCTASNGAVSNQDVALQMDVHDASLGLGDRWLVLGDSITNESQLHAQLGGGDWGYGGALSQVVNAATAGVWYPAIIDGGNGGQTMAWAQANIAGLLNGYSGGVVVLAFGTNDANQNFLYQAGGSQVLAYYASLLACIDAALALNNLVVVPYVPFGTANGGDLGINAGLFNTYVDAHLPTDRPSVLRGPNFWSFFNTHQSLIRDGIHPTFTEVSGAASGYEQMHALWSAWMVATVYATVAQVGTATLSNSAVATVTVSDSPGT